MKRDLIEVPFHSSMGEQFGVAIVDAHRSHVFEPISTIEVAGLVSFEGQVERKVTMPKYKDIHGFMVR